MRVAGKRMAAKRVYTHGALFDERVGMEACGYALGNDNAEFSEQQKSAG